MNHLTLRAAVTGVLLTLSAACLADYPEQQVTIVCTDVENSETDNNARLLASFLQKELTGRFKVENDTGGTGVLAINRYKNAAPDGYTLIATNTAQFAGQNAPDLEEFDREAFTPVAVFGRQSGENIVVNASSRYKILEDLLTAARRKTNKLRFGVDMGSSSDLVTRIFEKEKGAYFQTFNVVKSAEGRIRALLNKNIDVTIVPFSVARRYIEDGKLRNLATLRSNRLPDALEVPTVKESGLAALTIDSIFVLYAPKNTPAPVIEKLNQVILTLSNENKDYRRLFHEYNFQDPYALNVQSSRLRIEMQLKHVRNYNSLLE